MQNVGIDFQKDTLAWVFYLQIVVFFDSTAQVFILLICILYCIFYWYQIIIVSSEYYRQQPAVFKILQVQLSQRFKLTR